MARVLSTVEGTHEAHAFGPADWLLFAVPPLIWGFSFLFIAVGLEHFAPSVVTAGRIGFGALALGALPASRRSVPAREWPRILFVSATWMAIPFTCFSVAEQWISSSLAGMLNGAMPLVAAIVAGAMLRRLPTRPQVIGLLIGFGGVVLVMWPALHEGGTSSLTGVGLVLLAITCYGLATNVSVPLQQRYGSLAVTFRSQLGAFAMTAPFALVGLGGSTFGWRSLGAVAALGAFGTGLAFVALGALLARVGGARASVAVYFVPVVAVLAGVFVHGEHVEAVSLVGMALVVCGAVLTGRAGVRQPTPAAG
jgi:drug/metabolite transporter (DMT)-like permease